MSGYSGKPLVQKLGIKPGFCIFAAGAPAAYADIVGELPARVTRVTRLRSAVDMIHVFATKVAALGDRLPAYRDAIKPDSMVWVSWPKKPSGVATDLTGWGVRKFDDFSIRGSGSPACASSNAMFRPAAH